MSWTKSVVGVLGGAMCLAVASSAHAISGAGSLDGASGTFGEGASAAVDNGTGAAVANIPFLLPKARGGVQPSLGLTYNSQGGVREAGVGWGLVGLDTIERRGAHGDSPRWDNTDWYALNGAPLVPTTCMPGMPAAATTCYRLQTGGAGVRIYSTASGTWVIQSTSGATSVLDEVEYQDRPPSQNYTPPVRTGSYPTASSWGGPQAVPPAPWRWLLSRRVDSTGNNFVRYRWTAKGVRGRKVLTDIFDTVADPTDPERTAAHHVRLVWEVPDRKLPRYAVGWVGGPDVRLARVDVAAMPWGPVTNRTIVRRYRLRYAASSDAPNPTQSFLVKVQMEGRCSTPIPEGSIAGDPPQWEASNATCSPAALFPPVTMEYASVPYPMAPRAQARASTIPLTCDGTAGCNLSGAPSSVLVDINQDGFPDLVRVDSQTATVHRAFLNDAYMPDGHFMGLGPMRYRAVNSSELFEPSDPYNPNSAQIVRLMSLGSTTAWGDWGNLRGTSAGWLLANAGWGFTHVEKPASEWKWKVDVKNAPNQYFPVRVELTGDIDGDGVVDGIHPEANPLGQGTDPDDHIVAWSRRRSGTEITPFDHKIPASWPPSATPVQKMNPRPGKAFNAFVDVNGDGAIDLVRLDGDPTLQNRNYVVFPGRGDGTFGCDSGKEEDAYGSAYWTNNGTVACAGAIDGVSYVPLQGLPQFTFTGYSEPQVRGTFVDVTGDGLADYVDVGAGSGGTVVTIYRNVDGRRFQLLCLNSNGCSPDASSVLTPDSAARVSFLDMNGNGTTDIILQGTSSLYVFDLLQFDPNYGTRAGLLTSIKNGLGVETTYGYYASLESAQAASRTADGTPWQTYAATTAQPVYKVTTSVTPTAPFASVFPRSGYTLYRYRDPAYDVQARKLVGFRKVTSVALDQSTDDTKTTVTDTSYFFTNCQGTPATVTGSSPIIPGALNCAQGSENEQHKAIVGAPYLVEVSEGNGKKRSTTIYQYQVDKIADGLDGRTVTAAYPRETNTWIYDPNPASNGGTTTTTTVVGVGPLEPTTEQTVTLGNPTGRAHLRWTESRNLNGTIIDSTAHGRVTDATPPAAPGEIDEPILVHRDIQSNAGNNGWMELPTQVTTSGRPSSLPRVVKYAYYDSGPQNGRVKFIHTDVLDAGQLIRDMPGTPMGAMPFGATTNVPIGYFEYDAFGNTTKTLGAAIDTPSGGVVPCTQVQYDTTFNELPTSSVAYSQGCGLGDAVGTSTQTWDRGFQRPTLSMDTNFLTTTMAYDAFGRPTQEARTTPDGASSVVTATTSYFTNATPGLHQVRTQITLSGGETTERWAFLDGLGGTLFTLSPSDAPGTWIVSGMNVRSLRGRVTRVHRPFEYAGLPAAVPMDWPVEPYVGRVNEYDDLGALTRSSYGGDAKLERKLHALSVDLWDAMDLSPGATYGNTPTTVFSDGHGRTIEERRRLAPDVAGQQNTNVIATLLTYQATGEVTKVVQMPPSGMGTPITRWMKYDSLGRLAVNAEPNTTDQFSTSSSSWATTKGWRYVYNAAGQLVGTSDARGCGKNIYYDGLGRVTAEDWLPCAGSSPGVADYSPPNFATGDGLEVRNTYGSTIGELGRLVKTEDRGSRTQISHDLWGRATSTSRRIAKPGAPIATLANRYTAHAFTAATAYDTASRVVSRTTGADVPMLLPGGTSALSYHYGMRGAIDRVESSYGVLLDSVAFDEYGRPFVETYGDANYTTARRGFQATSDRLTDESIGPYLAFTEFFHQSYVYDPNGNPTTVYDSLDPGAWDPGAKPRNRSLTYDILDRLTDVSYGFPDGPDTQVSVFQHETLAGDHRPVPRQTTPLRTQSQSWTYGWNGNVQSVTSTAGLTFDRSLSAVNYGTSTAGPNRLQSAAGGAITAAYDKAGNLVDLLVKRNGPCEGGKCIQRYSYDYDEVNQLTRARRWDYSTFPVGEPVYPALPGRVADFDLAFGYSGGSRVLKTVKDSTNVEAHTVDVFDSLRLSETGYDAVGNDYLRTASTEHVFLPGFGRVVYDGAHALPSPSGADLHVFLTLRDRLGSASVVIDHETGELVEKMTYLEYGAPDSDYRPERWGAYRAENRYTGKEDDIEVGLTYFGARYYSPYLHTWTQADPLTIHGLGADLNAYAFVGGNPARRIDRYGLIGDDGPSSGACTQVGSFVVCAGFSGGGGGGGGGTSGGGGGGSSSDSSGGSGETFYPPPPPPPPPPVAEVPPTVSAPKTWGWDPPEVRQGSEPIYWVGNGRSHSGSAGGWSGGVLGFNPFSHTDVLAGAYPSLASSIEGPGRQELTLQLAAWALAFMPALRGLGAVEAASLEGAEVAAAEGGGSFISGGGPIGGGGGGPGTTFISGPSGSLMKTGLSPAELLTPNGVRIGQAGASSGIRVIQGGTAEAEMMFEQLSAGGTPLAGGYPGTAVTLPGGGFVGMRTFATGTGARALPAATIDVNIPGIGIRELKFVP